MAEAAIPGGGAPRAVWASLIRPIAVATQRVEERVAATATDESVAAAVQPVVDAAARIEGMLAELLASQDKLDRKLSSTGGSVFELTPTRSETLYGDGDPRALAGDASCSASGMAGASSESMSPVRSVLRKSEKKTIPTQAASFQVNIAGTAGRPRVPCLQGFALARDSRNIRAEEETADGGDRQESSGEEEESGALRGTVCSNLDNLAMESWDLFKYRPERKASWLQHGPDTEALTPQMLPRDWPKGLQVRRLTRSRHKQRKSMKNWRSTDEEMDADPSADNIVSTERPADTRDTGTSGHRCERLMDPSSPIHIASAMAGIMVLAFDLTIIPYTLAWQVGFEGVFQTTTVLSAAFWSMDIGLTFIKGFYLNGDVVFSIRRIATRYCKTWLLPDIIMVSCDWVGIIIELTTAKSAAGNNELGDTNSIKMLRFVRLGRLLRIVGLARMLRVFQTLQDVILDILSEDLRLTLWAVLLAMGALWLTHLMACAWWAVGRYGWTDSGIRWAQAQDQTIQGDIETGASEMYQYATAYHWSLAQVTLGSMEITCVNSGERLFNVVALIIGLFGGSALVSVLSANMVEFQTRQRDRKEKVRYLRRYLALNLVEPRMTHRVLRQVSERLESRGKIITEDMVQVLEVLSSSLRMELHYSITKARVLAHPLFFLWGQMDAKWTQRMCYAAIKSVTLRISDELFPAAAVAEAAYIMDTGMLQYTQRPEYAMVSKEVQKTVGPDSWLSESAIWCRWVHVGTAEALTTVRVLAINTTEYCKLVGKHLEIAPIASEYRNKFYTRIVSSCPPFFEWPTDLRVPLTDFGEIMYSLDEEMGSDLSLQAISMLDKHDRGFFKTLAKTTKALETAVMDGQCRLLADSSGKVFETQCKVCVNAFYENWALFQVGYYEASDGDFQIEAALEQPGTLRNHEELTEEAVHRLLKTKLKPLVGTVRLTSTDTDISDRPSQWSSVISTRCYRTTFNCEASSMAMGQAAPSRSRPTVAGRSSEFSVASEGSVGRGHSITDTADNRRRKLMMKDREVFPVGYRGVIYYYAWLTAEEHAYLDTASGHGVLARWLRSVVVTEANGASSLHQVMEEPLTATSDIVVSNAYGEERRMTIQEARISGMSGDACTHAGDDSEGSNGGCQSASTGADAHDIDGGTFTATEITI